MIHGGITTNGRSNTSSVVGSYCSTSISSLRNTTRPGVAAVFSPSTNDERSTWLGQPSFFTMSCTKFFSPRTTLVPPVSNARLIAFGLPSTKLVGDSVSLRMLAANSAFDASLPSRCAAPTSSWSSRAVSR